MSTIDIIKATFTAVGETFNYGYIEHINDILYNEDMPTTFVLPPVDTTMVGQWRGRRMVLNAYFVNGSDSENTDSDKEYIIDGCRQRACKWLYAMSHGSNPTIVGEPTMTRVDFELNCHCVGVRVRVVLSFSPESYCDKGGNQ